MELSAKQLKELLCCEKTEKMIVDGAGERKGIRIVVLQRGWVAVGWLWACGQQMCLEHSSIIRRWGTTKGLGEIVTGPTSKTVLDPVGTIRFNELGAVLMIDCDEKGWADKCR